MPVFIARQEDFDSFDVTDSLLANGNEVILNLPKFARPPYSVYVYPGFSTLPFSIFKRSSQYICILA